MLEILLLLHGGQPESMHAEEVATELGIEEQVAKDQLAALLRLELIAPSGNNESYQYHPLDEERAAIVKDLAVAYSRQRIPVLTLILAKRPDRIRLFAEAFRLVKGND